MFVRDKMDSVEDYDFDYVPPKKDLTRIVRVCWDNGYNITEEEARKAWGMYSADFCATWLLLPSLDEDLFSYIKRYVSDDEG